MAIFSTLPVLLMASKARAWNSDQATAMAASSGKSCTTGGAAFMSTSSRFKLKVWVWQWTKYLVLGHICSYLCPIFAPNFFNAALIFLGLGKPCSLGS